MIAGICKIKPVSRVGIKGFSRRHMSRGVHPVPRGVARAHRKAQSPESVDHVRLGREPALGVISEGKTPRRIGHGRQPSFAVGSLVVGVGDVRVGWEVRKSYTSTRMLFCYIWDLKIH